MTLDETWEPSEAQKQLPWLLVTVMVALDLVLNPRDELFPNLNAAAYVGFCLGQVAVVSTWLVFGRLHFLLRLVGALGTIGCLSFYLRRAGLWRSPLPPPSRDLRCRTPNHHTGKTATGLKC